MSGTASVAVARPIHHADPQSSPVGASHPSSRNFSPLRSKRISNAARGTSGESKS